MQNGQVSKVQNNMNEHLHVYNHYYDFHDYTCLVLVSVQCYACHDSLDPTCNTTVSCTTDQVTKFYSNQPKFIPVYTRLF